MTKTVTISGFMYGGERECGDKQPEVGDQRLVNPIVRAHIYLIIVELQKQPGFEA